MSEKVVFLCNICYLKKGAFLSSCGCFYCNECFKDCKCYNVDKPTCLSCKKSWDFSKAIDLSNKESIKRIEFIYDDPESLLKKVLECIKFQKMHKKKYIEFLEKKLESIYSENIKLKEQLGLTKNKIVNSILPHANQQLKIIPGINLQNNPNQTRPGNPNSDISNNANNNPKNNSNNNVNYQNSINNNNLKYVSNSANLNAIEVNNLAKSNIPQNRNSVNNLGNSAMNSMMAMPQAQMNNPNLIDLSNIKKIEQKRPDRSSNKNTGFQDKNVYMDLVKTDNLNASTAKNLRSSPQIVIRNPNLNSNQKNLMKNNLSNVNQSFQVNNSNYNINQSNLNKNLKIGAEENPNFEKNNFYKQGLNNSMISSMNQSTLNSSFISTNVQENSPLNYSRTGQINNNNKFSNNSFLEDGKNTASNTNFNNTTGALTNSNINNIINRKRNYHQITGIDNLTNLTSQNVKIIDVNEQSFKTPINQKNDQYQFQVKKFKYQV